MVEYSAVNRGVSAEEEKKSVTGDDKSEWDEDARCAWDGKEKGVYNNVKGQRGGTSAFLVFRCSFQECEPSSTGIQVSAAL